MNKLTAHHFLYPILALALVACGVWIAKQEIANARAEEKSKAHDDAIKQINDLQTQSHAELKTALDALAAEKAKPATVQTVTKYLPAPVPQGSTIEVKKADGQPCSPDGQCGQGQVILTGDTQTNLNWIRDMELSHQVCDDKFAGCQKDLTFAGQKLTEMTKKSDTWENDAKGGSKGHRLVKGLKIDLGAGIGAGIGALADRQHPWRGAAIGAGTGAMVVQIFW